MAFETPTLNDFVRISENGLSTAFYGESSVLRKSVLKVLARVFAGVAFLVVLLLKKMWKNVFLTTCDVETLKDFGVDFDLPNKPESFSKGLVIVKASSASTVLSQGTVLITNDDVEFEVVADTTIAEGSDGTPVGVIALASGANGNCSAGTELSFRDGVPEGLGEEIVVDSEGLDGGFVVDVTVNGNVEKWGETVEEYRTRLLNYRRNQPHGGCDADYKTWAERFSSVSRCIPEESYPTSGAVTCVLANYHGNDITLNSTNVAEVEAYIKSEVRRPITANVAVVSCSAKPINLSIYLSSNTPEVRQSVMDALNMAFRSYVPGDVIRASDLTVAIKVSATNVDYVNVTSVNGSDSVRLSKPNHELPVVGDVGWT